jgi:hypothetical protein
MRRRTRLSSRVQRWGTAGRRSAQAVTRTRREPTTTRLGTSRLTLLNGPRRRVATDAVRPVTDRAVASDTPRRIMQVTKTLLPSPW